ncbi:MAG: hypothetical protein A4E60_03217 [Syntrophorhabdus sp. PtaB.Bin047]|nr:MAG: hypothetical protein A4E60_03217 [Syntrophorhabdus sp. PtaB.Bin047]
MGQDILHQLPRRSDELHVHREDIVLESDGDFFLRDDIARVRFFHHEVKGDPRALLARYEDPVNGAAAAVLRQEGTVKIEGADARYVQDGLRDHLAIIKREHDVRAHFADEGDPLLLVQALRHVYGNSILPRELHGPAKPYLFAGVVIMGEQARHIGPGAEELFQADVADLLVCEYDSSHMYSFLMMYRGRRLTSW